MRNAKVSRPDQVWAKDITYLPMARGFLYLVAIMDWHSRSVVSWRLTNTLGPGFYAERLARGKARGVQHGQGASLTTGEFTPVHQTAA